MMSAGMLAVGHFGEVARCILYSLGTQLVASSTSRGSPDVFGGREQLDGLETACIVSLRDK